MKVKLANVRLAFPDLFEATQFEGKGEFRYNATFLIERGSANDRAVQAAIMQEATEKFGKKADAMLQSIKGNANKFCYLNGDLKEYDGYQGMNYLSGHRKLKDGRPLILGTDIDPSLGPDENGKPQLRRLQPADGKPYAGCYVNASVDIYAQTGQYAGMRCGLLGVQFAADGDSFSGVGKPKADDFDAIEDGATADSLV